MVPISCTFYVGSADTNYVKMSKQTAWCCIHSIVYGVLTITFSKLFIYNKVYLILKVRVCSIINY